MEAPGYQDPEYPAAREAAGGAARRERARSLLRRELRAELAAREREVAAVDQRMWQARRSLHRLRSALLRQHYGCGTVQPGGPIHEEAPRARTPRSLTSAVLHSQQRRLHPSQRRLTARQLVTNEEIFLRRHGGGETPQDVTIAAGPETSLRGDVPPVNCDPGQSGSGAVDVPPVEEPVSKPKKIPRHIEPECSRRVVTLDSSRSQQKHKYRIIIGNTSKYSPAWSRADRSTHKWLLYVRGPDERADVSRVVSGVTVRLHESYAPHRVVHIGEPPYRLSRRGWGEFAASVELHFALPALNRPAAVQHTVKLDRRRSGLQSLGAETIVDVWLYSNEEMLKYACKDTEVPEEPIATEVTSHTDEPWSDFFSTETTELDIDEMIIKPVKKLKTEIKLEQNHEEVNDLDLDQNLFPCGVIKEEPMEEEIKEELESCLRDVEEELVHCEEIAIEEQMIQNDKQLVKYVDPNTGKVFYLEMDRGVDVNKVQEIVLNSNHCDSREPVKNGLSIAKDRANKKGEVQGEEHMQLANLNTKVKHEHSHIENDHCYLSPGPTIDNLIPPANKLVMLPMSETELNVTSKEINTLVNGKIEIKRRVDLGEIVSKMNCVRSAVSFALSKIPLVSKMADSAAFKRMFPFVVRDEATFWQMDEIRRRNIEWSRAKIINRLLTKHFADKPSIWRTKQILFFARLRGHHPARPAPPEPWDDSPAQWEHLDFKKHFPTPSDINSGSIFDETRFTVSEPKETMNSTDVIELPCDSDDEIDVTGVEGKEKVGGERSPVKGELEVLPIEDEEERLRCYFVERVCADIGVELRNEDVGSGFSHSAVHRVLLAAARCFAADVLRAALAELRLEAGPPRLFHQPPEGAARVCARHVHAALRRDARMNALTADGLCAPPARYERL